MVGYGRLADKQSFANLLILQTFADQRNHLALPVGQRLNLRNSQDRQAAAY